MHPSISVIVPCFNVEKYLAICLESILSQNFEDYEVLCVDDCSTDGTPDILQAYALKFNGRLKVLKHSSNMGLGAARNTALKHAAGEFIASVDSDDWIERDMLYTLHSRATNTNSDITVIGYKQISEDGSVAHRMEYSCSTCEIEKSTNIFALCNPAVWNKLFKKTLFTHNNIKFPRTLAQDLATTPKLVAKAMTIAFATGTPYNYRSREGSEVQGASIQHLQGYTRVFHILEEYFADRLLSEREFFVSFCSMINSNLIYHLDASVQADPVYSQAACILGIGFIDYLTRLYATEDHDYASALRKRLFLARVQGSNLLLEDNA